MNLSFAYKSDRQMQIHQNILLVAIFLIVVSLPFTHTDRYSILLYRFGMIMMALNWAASGDYKNFRFHKTNLLPIVLASLYIAHAIGMLYTQNVIAGLTQLEKKISLLAFPVVLSTCRKFNIAHVKVIFKIFIITIIITSIICITYAVHRNNYLELFKYPDWFYFTYNDLTEILKIQPNYLAVYVGFSIIILSYFLTTNSASYSFKKKIAIFFLIFYLFFFLLLLSGRTSIVAVSFIVLTGIGHYFYKRQILLRGLVIMVALCGLLVAGISNIPVIKERFLQTFGIEQTNVWINHYGDGKGGLPSVRLLKWHCALKVISENWLLGVGTGDVQDALQVQYQKNNFELAFNAKYNTHNQYLQTWLGLGLVGLMLLSFCIVTPAVKAYREKNYLFLAFIALFCICSITESTLERQLGIVFYALFNSLLIFHLGKSSSDASIINAIYDTKV